MLFYSFMLFDLGTLLCRVCVIVIFCEHGTHYKVFIFGLMIYYRSYLKTFMLICQLQGGAADVITWLRLLTRFSM